MAGSYPDAPSRRMAYDDDGSVCVGFQPNNWAGITQWSVGTMQVLNGETASIVNRSAISPGTNNVRRDMVSIFPELREVDGWYAGLDANLNRTWTFQTSVDTTNGQDGTWVTQGTSLLSGGQSNISNVVPGYRNFIVSLGVPNIRGVRGWHSGNDGQGASMWHLYGEISAGQTPDRLLFVDNSSGLEYGLPIDYGDVPRGSAVDTAIKLRNNSGTLTASSIQLTGEDLAGGAGAWFTYQDVAGFQATLPLAAAVGPGADSAVITVRRIIPDAQGLGLYAARTQVSVGSWA